MKTSGIMRFLDSPLGKAIAGDFAIMGGIEAIRAVLQANKTPLSLPPGQQGNAVPSTPPPPAPPKDLHKALLKLTAQEIQEITDWMKSLHHAHKVELSKWELEDLEMLFKLPAEARTQLITTVTGPTPVDEFNKFKKWVKDKIPELNDESKAILKEWSDWAKNLDKH